jgi:putative transposase
VVLSARWAYFWAIQAGHTVENAFATLVAVLRQIGPTVAGPTLRCFSELWRPDARPTPRTSPPAPAATLYNWRRSYGGMDPAAAKELKELREQNSRLKRLLAEAELEKDAVREVAKGKF